MNKIFKLFIALAFLLVTVNTSAARDYNWGSSASTIDGVEVVRETTTQTLTNKTLTSPTLNSPTINTPTLNGFAKINQTATAMEIETDTNSSTSPVLTIDNNDTTNNPSTLTLENAGTGADLTTDSFTLTNGLIVPVAGVGLEIDTIATGNAVALTVDQDDTTGNNTAIKIENAGSGKDIETEALSLTNGKITLIDAIGFEIENAATGNAVSLTIDQNDTTGNNTALKIENAGSGADIATDSFTLTNGLIVPVDSVGIEIDNAATGNAVLLTLDQDDTTGNNSALVIQNAGSGKDIETEALSLTNGKITLVDAVGFEFENAATGNAVALTVDQNDTTGNNVALAVENAGTGTSVTITAASAINQVSINAVKQPYWISAPIAATTAAMDGDDGTGLRVGGITLAGNAIILQTILDVTTGYNEAGDTLEVHINTDQTIGTTTSELIADVDCSAATIQLTALADGATTQRLTATNKYVDVFYKDVGNDGSAAAVLAGVLYVQVLPQ